MVLVVAANKPIHRLIHAMRYIAIVRWTKKGAIALPPKRREQFRSKSNCRRDAMNTLLRVYFGAVGVALSLSSIGKLVGVWKLNLAGRLPTETADPLFSFLDWREMLLTAATLEILVVLWIWRSKSAVGKAWVTLWFTALVSAYRVGLKEVGFHGYCPCLGYWANWLALSKVEVNAIALGLLGTMGIGSLAIIVYYAVRNPTPRLLVGNQSTLLDNR